MIEAIYLNFLKGQAMWLIFIINFFHLFTGDTHTFAQHMCDGQSTN